MLILTKLILKYNIVNRDNNLYVSSLSEYFTKKVEEKEEILKREEKEKEEEFPSCIPPATALPGKNKAAKQGSILLDFNVFCNTDIAKGAKIFSEGFCGHMT